MSLFRNEVGRPSNEIIRKRNIFKGICVLLVLVIIGLVGYILNDKGIINLSDKNSNTGNEKVVTTTKVNNINNYNPKEAFDKFVKNHNLITYTDSETHSDDEQPHYDINALKAINCTTATMAIVDGSAETYSIEIFTFSDEESAKKEFKKQSDYQKTTGDGLIEVFDRKILTDKSKDNYDIVEIKSVVEDFENADYKSYDYYYGLRIDKYYITLHTANTVGDTSDEMIKLKDELNTLLNIK